MAKMKSASNQFPFIDRAELENAMVMETASVLSDYIRQYVGVATKTPEPGSGVFINFDRVLRTQTYQELAWYDLYDDLERDPHIQSIIGSAKMNVACLDWRIEPFGAGNESTKHSVSSRNVAIASFVQSCFEDLENFQQDIYELMDAIGKGFSVSEIIWKVGKDVRLDKIMQRPQRRIQFDASTRQPKLRTIANPYYGEPLPDKKFIIHRVSSKYENPFGDALDQSLYWMWLFKKMVLKFWMANLEVGTAPVPYVKHPRKATKEMKDEALAVARQIRQGAFGRVPDNFEVMFAETIGGANASFEQFVTYCDSQMTKCVNGQTLTSEASGTGGNGSRALGDVHQATQTQRDTFRAKGLEATLNATVVKWLVDYNFGQVEGYPRFKFITEEAEDLERESNIVRNITGAGFDIDEQELSAKFGYTITKKEAAPIAQPNTNIVLPESVKADVTDQQKNFVDSLGQIVSKNNEIVDTMNAVAKSVSEQGMKNAVILSEALQQTSNDSKEFAKSITSGIHDMTREIAKQNETLVTSQQKQVKEFNARQSDERTKSDNTILKAFSELSEAIQGLSKKKSLIIKRDANGNIESVKQDG